jgi:hypothetical protein
MNAYQKEVWSGVLFGVIVVGLLLGGWLVLHLSLH